MVVQHFIMPASLYPDIIVPSADSEDLETMSCVPLLDNNKNDGEDHNNYSSHEANFGSSYAATNNDEDREIQYHSSEYSLEELSKNRITVKSLGDEPDFRHQMEFEKYPPPTPTLSHMTLPSRKVSIQAYSQLLGALDYETDSENSEICTFGETESGKQEWEMFDNENPLMSGVLAIRHDFTQLTGEEIRKFITPPKLTALREWKWEPSPLRHVRTVARRHYNDRVSTAFSSGKDQAI